MSPLTPSPSGGGSAQPSAGFSVLVVEDEPAIRLVLANKLKQAGYVVRDAANGTDGLASAKATRPDLVITDYEMPRMDGLAMSRSLFEDPALRSVPVIVLSARGHRLGAAEAHDTNVQHMLMKPFSMREVLSIAAEYAGTVQATAPGRAA